MTHGYQHYKIVGWVTQDGPVCTDCKPTTNQEEERYDLLSRAKRDGKTLTSAQQDFLDEIEGRCSPIFAGEIERHWDEATHGLICHNLKCKAEIWEPDEEYSKRYRAFKEKVVGYLDAHGDLYCISDAEFGEEPLTPVHLRETYPDSPMFYQVQDCHYEHCYEGVLLDQFVYELGRFAYDWPDLQILQFYRVEGLLLDRAGRR